MMIMVSGSGGAKAGSETGGDTKTSTLVDKCRGFMPLEDLCAEWSRIHGNF
jgi:hypothetical protein